MKKEVIKKRTKIVATIGPSSQSKEKLEQMIKAGLNVARFNFSHGEHDWHREVMKNVREVSKKLDTNVAIMADLQGPRVRTLVKNDMEVKEGDILRVCDIDSSNEYIAELMKENKVLILDCPRIVQNIEIGHDILIEDGILSLKVLDKFDSHLVAEVTAGGIIKNHKGVNIPDAEIPLPTLTKKDIKDLVFALSQGIEYVAFSFVRTANDVIDLKQRIKSFLKREEDLPKVIAKIECKKALENLEEILKEVDAVMVARGDLGIEVNPVHVTLFQKDIITKCRKYLRPVIVATQMLASMEHNPRPTRAEIADVTNAVIDLTDATMLSAESTVGKYPVEAVSIMANIALETEASTYDDLIDRVSLEDSSEKVKIARSSYEFAKEMDAKAIVMYSESGLSALLLSQQRPQRMILVATDNLTTYRQLSLVWGVTPFLFDKSLSRRECLDKLILKAKDKNILFRNDLVVSVLGSTKNGKKIKLLGSRII